MNITDLWSFLFNQTFGKRYRWIDINQLTNSSCIKYLSSSKNYGPGLTVYSLVCPKCHMSLIHSLTVPVYSILSYIRRSILLFHHPIHIVCTYTCPFILYTLSEQEGPPNIHDSRRHFPHEGLFLKRLWIFHCVLLYDVKYFLFVLV